MKEHPTTEQARAKYWRKNITYLFILLAVWFMASLGAGVLFVDELDKITIPGTGFKLGFWMAQQGSILVFLGLIGVYVLLMNKLDKELLDGKEEGEMDASDH